MTSSEKPPGRGGGSSGLVRGPDPNTAAFFLLGKDFNTCYDAALVCLCACVCRKVLTGGVEEYWTIIAALLFEM